VAIKIPAKKAVKKDWPFLGVVAPGKGLNKLVSDEYIDNEEASDLLNVQFVENGCPAKRPGHTNVGSGLVANPKGLGSFYTGVNRYLLTVDGTSLKYLNSSTWTAISGVTFTTGKNTTMVQARGAMYLWNGTDAGAKLDSALTLTQPGTMPSGAFGIFYNGRQYAAGTSTQLSRLYVSNPLDASDFTVATGGTPPQPDNSTDVPGATTFAGTPSTSAEAFFIDVSKDDGDRITGLTKFGAQLIIFKERSTWTLTLDTSGLPTLTLLNGAIGCVSHRSIDSVDNDCYFLSRNGYYSLGYQANYTATAPRTNELSARIHPIVETIVPANLGNTCAIFDSYTYYSSVSTGGTTTNNTTVTYDTRYKAWSRWSNVNANAFTVFIDSSNVKHLYYASDDEARVYEIDSSYSDNGTAVSASWTSKALNFGDFSLTKQILYIDFEFRVISGTATVNVYTDGGILQKSQSIGSSNDTTGTFGDEVWGIPLFGGSSSTTTATSGGSSNNVPYRLQINKPSRTVKVQIVNNNNNESFVFLGFKVYYRVYNVQKFDSAHRLTGSTVDTPVDNALVTETGEYIITQ
jgi:hypothetical protein